MDLRAVLPHANRFEVVDSLAPPDSPQNQSELTRGFRRVEERDRLADGFLSRIAVHSVGRRIPSHNDAVQSLGNDRVIAEIHDGGHLILQQITKGPGARGSTVRDRSGDGGRIPPGSAADDRSCGHDRAGGGLPSPLTELSSERLQRAKRRKRLVYKRL